MRCTVTFVKRATFANVCCSELQSVAECCSVLQ